nr:reverse transcriptase domain-containing protein [Tanacetum cinerariifolium]
KKSKKLYLLVSVVMSADSAVTYSSAPTSPEYVLRDHVPVFVPEFEHPEDFVPAEDEAPTSLLPPRFLSPHIRPLSPKALGAEMNAIASSLYQSLHPSGTPPLLPILLSTPSTSCRAGILEADKPPQNRPLLATPRPGYVETRLRDTERRIMAALELVNLRVSYQVDVCTRESSEFCTGHHDAQKERAAVRAEIEVLRSERLAYEQEGIETRKALARSEAYYRALEGRVAVLETHARHLEQIMARTRKTQTPPPTNLNNPNNMTPEAVQTMIDQALLRNYDGGDGSYSSHAENPRNMHTARPCYYADFMHGCAVENQVKFATCTLLDATLTCWNSQIRTLGLDAYTMTWSVLKKKMTDKYCPLGEVKKLEIELWNLKVRDNNIPAYTNRFQEL